MAAQLYGVKNNCVDAKQDKGHETKWPAVHGIGVTCPCTCVCDSNSINSMHSVVPQVRSPQYSQSAVRGEGTPVLRVLRLNILWYLFI